MRKLETGAMPIDSDYAYIGTFIVFLEKLADVISKMFNNFVSTFGNLLSLLQKSEEETAEEE